jgi:hypothetical protein
MLPDALREQVLRQAQYFDICRPVIIGFGALPTILFVPECLEQIHGFRLSKIGLAQTYWRDKSKPLGRFPCQII